VAGSFRIAEGYVEVTADETGYDRAMQRLRSKKTTATVTLDIDDSAALAKLRRFADEHSRTVLKAVIDADLSEASVRRVSAALDRLTKDRVVNIRVQLDDSAALARLNEFARSRVTRITADLDMRAAADDLALLTRPRTTRITADADTRAAADDLALLTRHRTVNVRVDLDRSMIGVLSSLGSSSGGSSSGIKRLFSALTNLKVLAVGASPALASLGQALIQMGPAAAVAAPAVLSLGAAFAAIKIGTSGIGDAFKAAFAPATKSAGAAESSTRKVESAQRSLAKAQQAVKDAEVNAAEARVKAARDIQDAQQNLKNTVQDVADANRRAAESVASAERDLADAQRAARQAQQDLTAARKEAAQELEDLNNRLADAQLDQRQKVLDLQDAEQELAAVKAKGSKATQEELDKAQLAYDRAVQALQEQQTETARLQDQTDAANTAGVEGSQKVKKAKDDIKDANQEVADKTQALKDAEIEAARAQEDGAQRVAKAQRDVADAQAAAAKAAADGARQIADAQEAAREAAQALADAQKSGAAATSKVGDAMAKLAPNARAFVDAVLAQRDAWRGLKLDVQNTLFEGLGQKFTTMSTAILPSLKQGLSGTAGVLNTMAKNAMTTVTELGKTGMIKKLFAGLNEGLKPLAKVPGQFIKGLTQISIAASPAFKRVTTAAGGFFDRFSKQIDKASKNGHLEKIIDQALDIASQFGHLIGDIFGTLGNVMKAAGKAGGDALGALGETFKELRRITAMPEVQKALTSIFKAINAVAKVFATTLGAVIEAALPLLAAIAPVITELAEKFGPVLVDLAKTLGEALMPIVDALLPVVSDIGGVIVGLVAAVLPLLKPLGDLIAAIVTAIAPVLSSIGSALVPLIAALAQGMMPVVAALTPIVQMLGGFLAQLAPLFPPIITALLPLIPPIAQLTTALLTLALQVITPLMPLIIGLAQLFTGVLAGAIQILVPVITTVIGWITTFVQAMADGVKLIVDGFKWLYDTLVGHSIIPDLVKAIVSWFTSLWTKTKEIFTTLKNWVVQTWKDLWGAVRSKWDGFWSGLRSAVSGAWKSLKDSVSSLKSGITNTWNSLWNGAKDKVSGIFSTIRGKVTDFKNAMKSAFSTLRDSLGSIWNGVKSKIGSPIKWVIDHVYNNGIRKMWNTIAGKISSHLTLPTISLGFNKGGVVPGSGNSDTVPAMLTPGERILSKQQVDQLGGHRGIDAMLGQDHPTKTGGNPSNQQERKREQATQHFASGGIIGKIGSVVGGAVDWAKDLVIGGLQAAARKAITSLVKPLINSIPGGGVGSLLKGLSNKALDGILGFLGKEDKKAVGGPAVQRALAWVKTQDGKKYQWAGNGNPSWDCSGLMSAIESVIRGEHPHRRWATGAFSGSNGPSGWVRNLNSPFMIGITNAGVGHTAGTLAGMNVESSGGRGVHMGKSARGYNDPMFTSRWGFKPATKYDTGGLLQPGATLAVNNTGRPEAVLTADERAQFQALIGGLHAGMSIQNLTVSIAGTFDLSSPSERKKAANAMVVEIKEALRNYDRGRAR
jgi:phage-related protein